MARHPNPHLPYESYFPGISPPLSMPLNKDVPYVNQNYTVMNCTMGNWTGDPDSYAYQWKLGATNAGTNSPTYTIVVPTDVGKTATCIVTATNLLGSTAAPVSNGAVIATPASLVGLAAFYAPAPEPEAEPKAKAKVEAKAKAEPEPEPKSSHNGKSRK
jgi:hypothetical protein